jgi:hypothetical protein
MQAVWECETLFIKVPDDVPPEGRLEWVHNYLDTEGTMVFDGDPTITGAVEGYDIEISIEGVEDADE